MRDMGVVHVSSEDQQAITSHKHYLHSLPEIEERNSQASSWKRKLTMYRGTAPSLVLCLILLYYTFYSTAVLTTTNEVLKSHDLPGKHAYLQHMKNLFDSFSVHYNSSLDSSTLVRRLTVMGVVSELLNIRDSPIRTLMPYTRGTQILQQGDDGSFKIVVTVDPPSKGEQCFLVQGYVNYADLSGSVTKIQPVSCRERPEIWSNLKLTEWSSTDPKLDPYSNGSKGIDELMRLSNDVDCKRNSKKECGRGTVAMDPWVSKTISFQRRLTRNVSINRQQIIGSHNSFNDRADGYGDGGGLLNELLEAISKGQWNFVWAQQYFSLTDQLNFGSRYLMLDPVYFWGAMRLCHSGTTFKWIDKVIDFVEKVLNKTFPFDSGDLGCLPDDRKFEDGLKEIQEWVTAPGHENEVIMILINDFAKDHDWGRISLIHNPIRELFGDMIFSPNDKQNDFPDRWPTTQELLELGKRVIMHGPERCANASLIFLDMTVPAWDKDTMKYFSPYPECGGYQQPGQWYVVGGESQIIGPIYNGPEEEGLITTENMPYLMQCPVTILKIDLISPGLLDSAVWSWAKGYSVDNLTSSQCSAMNVSDSGRWVTVPCSTQLLHACQNGSSIVLSKSPATWNSRGSCPEGFSFYLPRTSYENWQLYQLILSDIPTLPSNLLWLNLPLNINFLLQ